MKILAPESLNNGAWSVLANKEDFEQSAHNWVTLFTAVKSLRPRISDIEMESLSIQFFLSSVYGAGFARTCLEYSNIHKVDFKQAVLRNNLLLCDHIRKWSRIDQPTEGNQL